MVRSPRWRRALVAACLPYLLMAVFADFVHLHPLQDAGTSQSANAERVATSPQASKVPKSPCAVCQWLRSGTGLQPSVAAGATAAPLASAVAARVAETPLEPILLSPGFRGPPLTPLV